MGADDSAALHLADTLAAGDGLCDPAVAAGIVVEAPAAIAALEQAGVRFDRNAAGELRSGLEAAHSRRRIVHAEGDGSGAAIIAALVRAVMQTPLITVLEGLEARRMLMDGEQVAGLLARRRRGCSHPADVEGGARHRRHRRALRRDHQSDGQFRPGHRAGGQGRC
jgi:L-aspartate oxidase